MQRRILIDGGTQQSLLSHPALTNFVEVSGKHHRFNENWVLITHSLGADVDLICHKSAVFLFKLSELKSPSGTVHETDPFASHETSSREQYLRRRYNTIMAISSNRPPQVDTLVMLLYCDEPQPDLGFLTWCNMTAMDSGCKLLLVWNPSEASVVLECLSSDAYNSEGHLQASILTANKRHDTRGKGIGSNSVNEALCDAFTAIPTIQQSDTSRLLNESKTVAQLLMSDPSLLANKIPMFTAKKGAKLHEIFTVEFPTTSMRLSDVQKQLFSELPAPTDSMQVESIATPTFSQAMVQAMLREAQQSDEED